MPVTLLGHKNSIDQQKQIINARMAKVSKNLEFENQAEAALDLGDKNGEKRKNQTFHLKLYR